MKGYSVINRSVTCFMCAKLMLLQFIVFLFLFFSPVDDNSPHRNVSDNVSSALYIKLELVIKTQYFTFYKYVHSAQKRPISTGTCFLWTTF